MIEYRLRKTAPEYSEELIQHNLSEVEKMTEEVKKYIMENLIAQYEKNKEYYDKKLLDQKNK